MKDQKDRFWEFLEKETNDAEFEGNGLIIQMDGNLHAGPQIVKKAVKIIVCLRLLLRCPFDSFMYSLFMMSRTSLCSCLITTLFTRVFDYFMHSL